MTQPTKKIKRFAGIAACFLLLAALGTTAWTVFSPVRESSYLSYLSTYRGEPYFSTDKGIFKYSETKARIQWLIKSRNFDFFRGYIGNGKLAYVTYPQSVRRNRIYMSEELWTMNTDGSGRRRIQASGEQWKRLTAGFNLADCILSPDGKDVLITAYSGGMKPQSGESPLWFMHTDGTGLKNLPVDARLSVGFVGGWLRLLSWSPDGEFVLIYQTRNGARGASRIWSYDLNSMSSQIVLDGTGWPSAVGEDFLAFRRMMPNRRAALALLNLKTNELTDLSIEERAVYSRLALSRKGDRMVVLINKHVGQGEGPFAVAVYSLAEKSITAETSLGMDEHNALLSWPDWLANDAGIVLNDRSDKCLRILDPMLKEEKRISYPPGLRDPVSIQVVGDMIVVEDFAANTLWRLDLRTGSWKRIY